MNTIGRREFLAALGAVSVADVLTAYRLPPTAETLPPTADIKFGCAAITWQGNDRQAIEDVAACGYRGIQLRSSILPEFGERPAALKEILDRHGVALVALSSGDMRIDPAVEREEIEAHVTKA